MKDVLIIGGGLSGLTAAYFLKKNGFNIQVLEANNYLGGRIKTIKTESNMALEMGATWVFNDPNLKALIAELDISLYPQYSSGTGLYEVSLNEKIQEFNSNQMTGGQRYDKVVGGTSEIITSLSNFIGNEHIEINAPVAKVIDNGTFIHVITTDNRSFEAQHVVVTIPPRLLEATVVFEPKLNANSNHIRQNTHTWMADSVKFSVEYKNPFWREKGYSGLAVSNAGLVREIQDQVNNDFTAFGLVGFMMPTTSQIKMSKEQRKELVIKDLVRLFGDQAKEVLSYEDLIWSLQPFTAKDTSVNLGLGAHKNNGHLEIVAPQMGHKLFFSGAETSATNPGYMEGAVQTAKMVVQKIISKTISTKNIS